MAGRLEGKIAVVTGEVSGIGCATVELFVRDGARCVAGDIADEQGAQVVEAFLASDDAEWITGHTLRVDGGITAVTTHSVRAAFEEAHGRVRGDG